ncbi:hypothetical protein HY989_02265 [Candidatus Micrarchaeota archaeon]|nr:hypothetical protein [Candidatus Micrarchaeota archaeon]
MIRGLFSSDFLAAMVIFIAALLIVGPMWNSLNAQVFNLEENRQIHQTALQISDFLLRTSGSPYGWNTTNFESIGISDELRVINATKAKYFFQLMASNYSDSKYMLGAGPYDMAAQILDSNGDPIIYAGTTFSTSAIPANASEISNVQRVAILKISESQRQFVNLRIQVWRN